MRIMLGFAATLFVAGCGSEQDSARFERMEDRADIESPAVDDTREQLDSADPGYRHEAPLHVDQEQEVAPPAPEDG